MLMNTTLTAGYLDALAIADIAAAWQQYKGCTVRPLLSMERLYRTWGAILADSSSRLLLYGGTPELRDAIHAIGAHVTIVDRSAAMVEAMGLLTQAAVPLADNETFRQADWRALPLPDGSCDLLLGDDAINMLAWGEFGAFLSEASRVLAPGGWFLCHLLVQPDEPSRRQSVVEVIHDYQIRRTASFSDFASRVNFACYDEATYQMGWQHSIARVRELLAQGVIATDEGFCKRFRLLHSRFTCPPRPAWEAHCQRWFAIAAVCFAEEYEYCRFEPLYVLRKQGFGTVDQTP